MAVTRLTKEISRESCTKQWVFEGGQFNGVITPLPHYASELLTLVLLLNNNKFEFCICLRFPQMFSHHSENFKRLKRFNELSPQETFMHVNTLYTCFYNNTMELIFLH